VSADSYSVSTTIEPEASASIASNHIRLEAIRRYLGCWHGWYWALVPLLATVAYGTVLRVGFLADDFFQLNNASARGIDPFWEIRAFDGGYLRPVGTTLIYQVGWALWGYNPLPYHAVGLAAHAASSLLLGLWLFVVSRKRALGWLAAVLFAVFPLHAEAVAWVATQYDAFSVLFTVASLFCFTLWWSRNTSYSKGKWWLYVISWVLFFLAVFTKKSVFTFVPMFTFSAWLAAAPIGRKEWRRLLLASGAFLIPVVLNVGIRYAKLGTLGGYAGARNDYLDFAWDYLAACMRRLLAPLNLAIFGNSWVQIVGMLSTLGLLVGLTLYGRDHRRLLLLAGVWIALTLFPVLNLAYASDEYQHRLLPATVLNVPEGLDNLQQSRHLYVVSAGFLVGVAVLIYSALVRAGRFRLLAVGLVASLVVVSAGVCWVQLRPWHTASVQVSELEERLLKAIPPDARPNGMTWYADRIPYKYEGVSLLVSGLGIARAFSGGDYPRIVRVADATQAPIADDPHDAFAIRFRYDDATARFVPDYLAGITDETDPPAAASNGNMRIWDFRQCHEDIVSHWHADHATSRCEPGAGLVISPRGGDSQLTGGPISLAAGASKSSFIRLRVATRYGAMDSGGKPFCQWYWKGPGAEFSEERSQSMPLKMDGVSHVYWTFLPTGQVMQDLSQLRFDPVNAEVRTEIEWIAVDVVK
jgi:hypothetical protein